VDNDGIRQIQRTLKELDPTYIFFLQEINRSKPEMRNMAGALSIAESAASKLENMKEHGAPKRVRTKTERIAHNLRRAREWQKGREQT
jgi:hypothetical protein